MSYIDGFVAAVPKANLDAYQSHVKSTWPIFKDLGALAMWECWGDDVPDGKATSFPMSVQAKDDETVVFSWTVWPDKETRDEGWTKMMSDPKIGEAMGAMPFDGSRMIYGGFKPIATLGTIPQ